MINLDWLGESVVDARYYQPPGTVEKANCGLCGAVTDVKRDVLGPTCFAEAMAGFKSRHDLFTCPNISADWHERALDLIWAVLLARFRGDIDYENKKATAKKEIEEILRKHTT